MKRVTGIGGIFFNAIDAATLQAWYKRHLGIDVQEWGGTAFTWTDSEGKSTSGTTIWSVGADEGDHFAPSKAKFMVNYRVEDLHGLVTILKEEGCSVLDKVVESEYGKFAWVIDPEGNKVEPWQPPVGQWNAHTHFAVDSRLTPLFKRSANDRPSGLVWRYTSHFRQPRPGALPSSPV